MATNENLIPIPGRLHSVATEGHVSGADEIFDDSMNKDQATINQEVNQIIGTGGSIDSRIATAVSNAVNSLDASVSGTSSDTHVTVGVNEVNGKLTGVSVSTDGLAADADLDPAAFLGDNDGSTPIPGFDPVSEVSSLKSRTSANESDIDGLQAAYRALTRSAVVVVADHTSVSSPDPLTIYREQGTNTYSDWMYQNGSWNKMAEYDNAIDDIPTAKSNNLVKSGGVYNALNKELIDTVYTGGWKGDGTETTSSGYYKTGKIPVIPNVLYYLSGNINTAILGGLAGIFLDSNSSVIQVIYKRGSTPITPDNPVVLIAPENAAYICLTFTGTNHSLKADLFSIAENNSKMISNLGKDFNTELAIGSNVANEYWKADGTTTTTTAAYIRTAKIPVKPYNVYHFKGSITSSIGNAKSLWFDSNNNVIGEVAELKNYPVTEVDIVAPEGAAYIAITSIGEFLPDLSLTLHYTGIHKAIEELGNRTTQIEENIIIDKTIKTVTCWGDSLTKGAGANNSYPEELQTLLGNTFEVSNYGHGGETANAIAFRKKGISVVVEPCTIVNGEWTTIQFKASNGLTLETLYSNANGTEGIRNLHFGNTKFMFVTTENPNEGKLYNSSGSDFVISRPMLADADGDGNGHVIIICMGQNGYCSGKSAKENPDAMIALHHRMIDENNTKRFIVITPPSNNTQYWEDYESRFGSEFGRNFLNAREYISKYGLSDNNLTPTSQDEEAMAVGAIPPQLLSDSVHFNAYGYIAFANCIYKRGQELGYW